MVTLRRLASMMRRPLILAGLLPALALAGEGPTLDAAAAAGQPARADTLLLLDAARAGGRIVAVGERGRILYSTDDGRSWRYALSPTEAPLTAVYFHDARHGWAVGHDAVILRTEDGGERWTLVHAAPAELKPLLDVWFGDARHGFAVGAYGLAYESADGGRHWRRRELLRDDMHLNAVAGGADGRVFLAGEAGTLLRSDDAGRSWRYLAAPYAGSFFGVLRLPDGNPLVFGLRGRAFRSPDGGRRWLPVATRTEATLLGGAVLADGRVVLVGHDGVVLLSRDGARSFAALPGAPRRVYGAVTGVNGLLLFGEGGVTRLEAARAEP